MSTRQASPFSESTTPLAGIPLGLAALLGLLLLGLAATVGAAPPPLPGQAAITDLQVDGDWTLWIDDEIDSTAEVYFSRYEVAWLVVSERITPLLISPRGFSVQEVDVSSLKESAATSWEVSAGSALGQVATATKSQGVYAFSLGEQQVELRPTPPLLGPHTFNAVEKRHPVAAERAAHFRARAAKSPMRKAAGTEARQDLLIKVYFGSWSSYSNLVMPKLLGLEKELGHLRFEYYGLPEKIDQDPEATERRISGVPTLMVLKDGVELSRHMGRELYDPQSLLEEVLAGI